MISPLQIEFRNSHATEAVESLIRQELAEFEKFYSGLLSCRVEVEAPKHERRGSVCRVSIDLGIPSQAGGQNAEHLEVKSQRKDASMAVHAAFNSARRRLKEFTGSPFTQT